jgi:hypothetical protein
MALDLQVDAVDRPLDNCVMKFEPALCVASSLRAAVYEQAELERPRTSTSHACTLCTNVGRRDLCSPPHSASPHRVRTQFLSFMTTR